MNSVMDWLDEYLVWILGAVCVLLIGGLVWAVVASDRQRDERCRELMAMSRTHEDTLTVAIRCKLDDEHSTTFVPMPIFIPTR